MREWASLTERGRVRRLRSLARAALDAYDVVPTRIRLVGGFTNVVYRIDTVDGPLALRIDLQQEHTDGDVDIEVAWLEALERDTELDVCRVVRSRDGRRYVAAEGDGVPGARRCVLQRWIPGAPLADRMSEVGYRRLGAMSASLHLHGATFTPPHRPMAWDRVFYWPERVDPVVIDRPEHQHYFRRGRRRLLNRALEVTGAAFELLDPHDAQVVHGDLHPWNVHVARSRLIALDFEDVMWAHRSQDIAITLYYQRDHPGYDHFAAAFEEGYRTIAPWPVTFDGEIDHFRNARTLSFVNYVLNLDDDPTGFFDRAFPRIERYLSEWG